MLIQVNVTKASSSESLFHRPGSTELSLFKWRFLHLWNKHQYIINPTFTDLFMKLRSHDRDIAEFPLYPQWPSKQQF